MASIALGGAVLAAVGLQQEACADGVVYTFQDGVAVEARDPFFDSGFRRHSGRLVVDRRGRIHRVRDPFHDRRHQVTEWDLENDARARARSRVSRRERSLRDVGGVVLSSGVESDSGSRAFRLQGSAVARGVFIVPARLGLGHSAHAGATLAAEGVRLRLVIENVAGGAPGVVPISVRELAALWDDPKDVRDTALGGLIRHSWREARGDQAHKSSKEKVSVQVFDATGEQLLGTFEMPNLKKAGIGGKKARSDPALAPDLSALMGAAMHQAESLLQAGDSTHWDLLHRIRRAPLASLGDNSARAIRVISGEQPTVGIASQVGGS